MLESAGAKSLRYCLTHGRVVSSRQPDSHIGTFMQARLKVVQDNANLKQVKLLPVTVIGRGADCHLKIASTQVSRKHCRITVTDNQVLIEDLTSSNGTFVDQARIESGKPIVIAPGAKLQIGPATF